MRPVSYRLDDIREKKLDQIFAFYGFTSDTASDNHKAMIDMLHELTMNRINSQTVGESLAKHENAPLDTTCNLRIRTQELVRTLKMGKTGFELRDVFYCIQWDKGKVKRQLKLVTPMVCEICSALREKWLEEQQRRESAPIPEFEPAPIKQPVTVTVSQGSQEQKPRPVLPDATWICDKTNSKVYYTVCLKCRKDSYLTFKSCILANSKIGLALAYWQKQS